MNKRYITHDVPNYQYFHCICVPWIKILKLVTHVLFLVDLSKGLEQLLAKIEKFLVWNMIISNLPFIIHIVYAYTYTDTHTPTHQHTHTHTYTHKHYLPHQIALIRLHFRWFSYSGTHLHTHKHKCAINF